MEPLIYSQSIRSTGDNLDLQLVPEVCMCVCVVGGSLAGLSP